MKAVHLTVATRLILFARLNQQRDLSDLDTLEQVQSIRKTVKVLDDEKKAVGYRVLNQQDKAAKGLFLPDGKVVPWLEYEIDEALDEPKEFRLETAAANWIAEWLKTPKGLAPEDADWAAPLRRECLAPDLTNPTQTTKETT